MTCYKFTNRHTFESHYSYCDGFLNARSYLFHKLVNESPMKVAVIKDWNITSFNWTGSLQQLSKHDKYCKK